MGPPQRSLASHAGFEEGWTCFMNCPLIEHMQQAPILGGLMSIWKALERSLGMGPLLCEPHTKSPTPLKDLSVEEFFIGLSANP